jgi:septal ring factor EnvC (AmiA/AmiB activator)
VKNITVPVAVAIAIVGCVLAVSASVNMSRLDQRLAQERYTRLAVEQKLQQAQKVIKQQAADLKDSQAKIGNIENILNQGKSTASDLKAQLDKQTKEKAALAQQLQQLQSQVQSLQAKPAGQATQAAPGN